MNILDIGRLVFHIIVFVPLPCQMIKQKNEINISQIIGRNFSRYAHTYDNHAQLQKLMAEKLASFLPNDTSEQILEIGCGTGLFTKYLLAKQAKKIFLNDISTGMIKHMRLKTKLPFSLI